jgi:hypothetical protein
MDGADPRLGRTPEDENMTLCPIAIVASCSKCPAVSVCPLKTVLGDAPKAAPPKAPPKK